MKFVLTAGLLFCAAPALADIAGTWKTEPGDTGGYLHVAIAPCGDKVCGTIQSAFNAAGEAIADYDHAGKPIIWGMRPKSDRQWNKGKIWAPDRDKTYSSKMELNGDVLKVSGCVAIICRAQNWTRVK